MTPAARYRAACAALELPVWRPGMRAVAVRPEPLDPVCSRVPDDPRGWAPYPGSEPDFTDAATVGCLLAAVREAWQDHGLTTVGRYQHAGRRWTLATGHRHGSTLRAVAAVEHDTEADALIAALEAAARRVRGRGGCPRARGGGGLPAGAGGGWRRPVDGLRRR